MAARMPDLAHIPYRGWLLIVFLIALVVGCIKPHNPQDLVLEHLLTVAFVGVMAWHGRPRERALSNVAYTGIFVFMLLHVLGANYTYSLVPYDRWSASLFGTSVSDLFGWPPGEDGRPRNHYDRLVHFSFGSLMLPAAVEIGRRHACLTGAWAYMYAACVLNVGSTGYELLEWLLTLVAAPEQAETYNGQQGDVWDAHKDVGLSALGSASAVVAMAIAGRKKSG